MDMPGWLDRLGALIDRTGNFWQRLGGIESSVYADELDAIKIDRPIYIVGLARSGTTIVLELLSSLPGVATHRYRDFPLLFTPIFWNRAFAQIYRGDAAPTERAHKDRILVTPDSPEAMEEVLWMQFFKDAHVTGRSQVLDQASSHPAFERFYLEHVKKILLLRRGRRYVAKGNYNLSRLAYLRRIFPDARFVVLVREPAWHIASLAKQHRLFEREETRDGRILKHMQRVGHFEFGLDRRAIDLGDGTATDVERLWREGNEVQGWARYWASLHRFVLEQTDRDRSLASAVMFLRYEDLCAQPQATLEALCEHVGLTLDTVGREALVGRLSAPHYYKPEYSEQERQIIQEETGSVAAMLGYRPERELVERNLL
jgi:hypothetical protein